MRYCVARFKVEYSYRIYITDALRIITENTARMANDGKYLSGRYADLLHPPKVDNRTFDEIVDDVVAKTGLKIIKGSRE